MATERTLTIIKPDAVAAGHVGDIIKIFEANSFKIVAARLVSLTREEAEGFYHVHRSRRFFASLVTFMTSGPIVPMVLEGEEAIVRVRGLMGATDPGKADRGTIRKEFASSIEKNVVHGSDGPSTAAFEIGYFFGALEIQSR